MNFLGLSPITKGDTTNVSKTNKADEESISNLNRGMSAPSLSTSIFAMPRTIPTTNNDKQKQNWNVISESQTNPAQETIDARKFNEDATSPKQVDITNNKLKSLLLKQEEHSNINSADTTTNFYAISQYILQSYFKANSSDLASLKLVDLIVDQTYQDSLTLRKLNETTAMQPYQYFNTVSRNPDISRCPIFALAVYFVIRWSHPNPPITINNYHLISLLDSNFIDPNAKLVNNENPDHQQLSQNSKILRSEIFHPSPDMIELVFPWLPALKQDMLLIDRTNYKLFSLCELFEFMGKVIIQDLRYLSQHSMLLPKIVEFISKFIPELFENEQFKSSSEDEFMMERQGSDFQPNSYDTNLQGISREGTQNGYINNSVLEKMIESQFVSLSKKLTTENIRLSQEITQLKSDLNSVTSMCNQILQLQRKIANGENQTRDRSMGNSVNGEGNIIILDKNALNSQLINQLVHSADDSSQQKGLENSQLAPIGTFNSLQSKLQNSEAQKRKLPFPSHQAATSNIVNVPMNNANGGASPYSPSINMQPDSPYNKRYRLEDKSTPSQNALDSLLSKSVASPRVGGSSVNGSNIMDSPRSNRNNSIDKKFFMTGQYNSPGGNQGTFTDGSFNRILSDIPYKAASREETIIKPLSPNVPILPVNTTISHRRQQGALKKLVERPTLPITESTTSLPPSPDAQSAIDSNQLPKHQLASRASTIVDPDLSVEVMHTIPAPGHSNLQHTLEKGYEGKSPRDDIEKNKKMETQKRRKGDGASKPEHLPPLKYKLSRDNKTIWDLYAEWYIGLNGQPSIRKLIEDYGYRRWKVSDDSHFFPTRRVIIDYIETECDRGIKLGRFTNPNQPREDIRKIIVGDLERFRINNALTLNSLSVYFRKLIKENNEICIFENFNNWQVRAMTEEEKIRYCKRQQGPADRNVTTTNESHSSVTDSQRPNMIAKQTFNNPIENPTTTSIERESSSSPEKNSSPRQEDSEVGNTLPKNADADDDRNNEHNDNVTNNEFNDKDETA